MQPNAQGFVSTYYGTWHVNDQKPKQGVAYFMLDERIAQSIDKEKEKLFKEVRHMLKTIRDENKMNAQQMQENFTDLRDMVVEMRKFVVDMVSLNELKTPHFLMKVKRPSKLSRAFKDEDKILDRGENY